MTNPLVATKFFVPKPRNGTLPRQRLTERLDGGGDCKLTLISAPAGFGKTTVLANWLAARVGNNRHVAWVSLEKADSEVSSFWTHVIAALQQAVPTGSFQQVSRPGEQPIEFVLVALVNALAGFDGVLDLVLDDYHVISQPDIQRQVGFLLEHLPPNAHLIICTRSDPTLPIARMRARGEVTEIRSTDLRFTAEETATYLNGSLGLGLMSRDVRALENRTEGWIAALQLAGLSMQGRTDLELFVAGFAGGDSYVFDYLIEEVLERQSDEVRNFLLETCFLDRLSGPLCDAVTGRSGNKRMLDNLHRANLLLVPLDDRREWYRYHHLFADVLLTQLNDVRRGELPALRRRASDWYDSHGERSEAIRHALAGGAFERAAELIELAIPEAQKNRKEALIRNWLRELPEELVRHRPVLGIGFVGALATFGELDDIEDRLRDIEKCLVALGETPAADQSHDEIVVVDESQLPRLPGAIELYRSALAQARGDVAATVHHARQVLELASLDDHLSRASGSSILGIGYWSQGKLHEALQSWGEGRKGLQRLGHVPDTLGVSVALADINLALGHLRDATQVYEQGLQLSATQGGPVPRGTADMHAGISELFREQNELQLALHHISKSRELGEGAGLPQHPYRWRVAMAHLLRDQGDLDGAATLLNEAERLYVSDYFPNVRPVEAIKARALIVQDRLDEAVRWQSSVGIGVDDELNYLREYEHVTLARLLLAQQDHDQTIRMDHLLQFMDRLKQAAERGGRNGSVIEISILQSLASRRSDIGEALVHLQHALALAKPEGYVRLFVNEGPPMEALLKLALKRGIAPAYVRKLQAAFTPRETLSQKHPDQIEPLSQRELDVLRLLASDLGGTEIAQELMVSPNTMRTHTKNIYDKLGVNSRRSAVRRAEELGLLARTKSL